VRSSVAASAAIGVGVTTSLRVSDLPIHCRSAAMSVAMAQ
jgi:hypothetical protein